MNIARMYTIALGSFGYTEDEARFLYLVAAHSGYFTCQQFLRFIDGKPGKRSLSFVRKLVEQGHASVRPYLRNGKVYHVFARNLYEAIGKDNVRFRRKHSTEYIRTRLAALDFILGRLDWKFLESESEKVRLFTEQLGIDKKYLPSKRYAGAVHERHTDRYFVDKFPMYLLPNPVSPPVVSFSFVDPGLESLDSLRTHLQAYLPLFFQLQSVRFHYIATRETHHNRAKELFMGHFDRHWNPDSPEGLVDFFCLRKRIEGGEAGKLSTADLIVHADAKLKFNHSGIEDLYQKWRSGQLSFDQVRKEYQALRRPETVTFIFSPVNGQVALFERHPRTLVKPGEEYLPLLKAPPKQPKSATIQIRVEEDVKLRLEKYAEFINSSPAYVVTEALKLLFKKDEEFKSWLGQHTNNDNLNQIEGASLTEIAKKA